MSSVPFVSIIIPTCNRTELLAACLEALVPQIPPDGSVELLVCDDGRDFQTRDFLAHITPHHPTAQWHRGPRKGPGANRNFGVGQARGEWLVFIDDDCVPRPGYLSGYLAAFQKAGPGSRAIFAGATYREREHDFPLLNEAAYYRGANDLPPACNFAMPRALYLEAGGFDERYRVSFEDIELFARLGLTGVTPRFLCEAAADHPSRPLPSPFTLAKRWEARVTSTYDFGASTVQVLWRLPRHVLMVILSRFRGRAWSRDNLRAAKAFACEFLITLWKLPGWVLHERSGPRSDFWKKQQSLGNIPRNFGL